MMDYKEIDKKVDDVIFSKITLRNKFELFIYCNSEEMSSFSIDFGTQNSVVLSEFSHLSKVLEKGGVKDFHIHVNNHCSSYNI